jgi:magnesium chelatase family protein
MSSKDIKAYVPLDTDSESLLRMALTELNLSARAYDRILKVARTIADLAGAEKVDSTHLSEAIQYRTLDRQVWG